MPPHCYFSPRGRSSSLVAYFTRGEGENVHSLCTHTRMKVRLVVGPSFPRVALPSFLPSSTRIRLRKAVLNVSAAVSVSSPFLGVHILARWRAKRGEENHTRADKRKRRESFADINEPMLLSSPINVAY